MLSQMLVQYQRGCLLLEIGQRAIEAVMLVANLGLLGLSQLDHEQPDQQC